MLAKKLLKKIYYKVLHIVSVSRKDTLLHKFMRAQKWIRKYTTSGKGICVTSKIRLPYPEVSGYYIPTLIDWGMRDMAVQYAQWLCSIQKPDGSWYDAGDNAPYIFDTAQILKGLIAVSEILPKVKTNIIKGCDWLISTIETNGKFPPPPMVSLDPSNMFSECSYIYCLAPLVQAGKKYNIPHYELQARRVLEYYTSNFREVILNFSVLSHFYAYIIEGLIDMNEIELAREAMRRISFIQHENGSIPAYKNVTWICSTGLFQFALIYYKLGDKEHGDKAFAYAAALQNRSGGWYGSYAVYPLAFYTKKHRPYYEPHAEISWAVKYFLDALRYKIITDFAEKALGFYDTIDKHDPLYILVKDSILKVLPVMANQKVKILDAGCGKGRYLKNLLTEDNRLELYGFDLSAAVLRNIPQEITVKQGSLLNIPYPAEYFDFVYVCEALEHCVNLEGALYELARVVKKGGSVLIIDKNRKKLGAMKLAECEQWFDIKVLFKLLTDTGFSVTVYENIIKNGVLDGIFCAWLAKKE
jgi:malonyl-CoA O-methyltransferase